MNYNENLTYKWLNKLVDKNLLSEETSSESGPMAVVNRALISYNAKNWTYKMGGKPNPADIQPGEPATSDCTGFVTWAWGLNGRVQGMTGNSVRIANPEIGCGFWYDPKDSDSYGHGGIVVAVYADGDYDTVDCGKSVNGLRYVKKAKGWWNRSAKGKEVEFYRPNSFPENPANPLYTATATGDETGGQLGGEVSYGGDWRELFKSLPAINPEVAKVAAAQGLIKEGRCGECGPIRLSDEQVAQLIYSAGFRGEDLVTMTRISLGESNGCVKVVSCPNNNGTVDRGLFQFNSDAFKSIPDEEALDAQKSAEHAFKAFKRYGFNPWKGNTNFHTLKAGKPDIDLINRANVAVEKVSGYKSVGIPQNLQGQGQFKSYSYGGDWKEIFKELPAINPKVATASVGTIKEADKLIDKKDAKKFKIKYKTSNKDIEKNKKLLVDMLGYFNKKLRFNKPVSIEFIDDKENSNKPLGKTAYYDPDESSITIFTTGRLFKDILRSLGHELIHHKQHCVKPFENEDTFEGYAQNNPNMRKKEKEAYLLGNMLFRDWEDNYKGKFKGVK